MAAEAEAYRKHAWVWPEQRLCPHAKTHHAGTNLAQFASQGRQETTKTSWFVAAQPQAAEAEVAAEAATRATKQLRRTSFPVDNPNRRQSKAKTAAVLQSD